MTLQINPDETALAMRRHQTAADYVFTRYGYRYRATCTCGYATRGTYADKAVAESAGRGHEITENVMDHAVAEFRARQQS